MIIAIVLLILIAILAASLFMLKSQIRSITRQLQQRRLNGSEKPVDISLIDKDIINLATEINNTLSHQKEQNIEILKREQQLKESISNISHDLRTPLTSIIGFLQLLNKTDLLQEQREYVDTVLSRSEDLRTLIGNFYDVSALEAKESVPKLERLNLDNILAEGILAFTAQFEKKAMTPHITFLNEPTFVIADEIMLKRVIYNVVSNATKYGTGDFVVSISKSDKVAVSFQNRIEHDNTIEVERLFERFYTSDLSRNHSGTGLGLFIVKLLMDKMSGTVQAAIDNDTLCITLSFIITNA